ncbi:MAG: ABC transporter permease [Candidatus Cyclobacteriaceae bacterium M3_2C_046]
MLKNFFTIGFRNILKQKFYAFINILGLTIGIAAAIFIVIYISDELSYDQFNEKADRLYRINLNARLAGQEALVSYSCPPMAQAMMNEIPEVENTLRIWTWDNTVVKYEDKAFTEDKLYHTDSTFFKLFSYQLLAGNPETALKEPNSVMINENIALKYFGQEDPLGKIITIGNDNQAFKVTGVLENPPSNSHIQYNFVTSLHSFDYLANSDQWLNNNLVTYFTTHKGANLANVQTKLDEFVPKYVGPSIEQFMGISLDQFKTQDGKYGYDFIPVKDIHLKSTVQGEFEPTGDIKYIYIFMAIGLFIIIIAAINFMNLSTARSAGRAKEVGMRKTFGSLKSQLVSQFLIESFLYSFFALILAILAVVALLPQFNLVAGKAINYGVLLDPKIIFGVLGIILIVALLAGSYPAFYLTSFNISEVIKGNVSRGMKSGKTRGVLVVVQFAISIFLLICTAIVFQQLKYTQNKNMGFKKENVLVIYNANRLEDNRLPLKQALESQTNVIAASYANHIIPGTNNTTIFRKSGTEEDHIISVYFADYEHMEAMGFELLEGRYFSRDFPSDSSAVVINEATAKQLNWDEPLQEDLISFNGNSPEKLKVIGVVKDFNYESLRENIRPLVLRLTKESNNLAVRFQSDDPRQSVTMIESEWNKLAPNEPFEYEFLDQKFDALYRSEQRMGALFTTFTIMAIFIACLGLMGLSAFTAEQKTKEIGIRKALGATGFNIITLLSKEFTRFVIIAFIIAIIPAYYFINQWLSGFAYKINIRLDIFLISGFLTLLIALLTVSYQSIKASRLNPTESLRYE